jgi:epoxyqueuosine reductase QueG
MEKTTRSGGGGQMSHSNDDLDALQAELCERALAMGATYFGVADLTSARQFITAQGGDFLAEYPVGISVGIVLADGVVDQLIQHLNGDVARTYCHHIYAVVAEYLDHLAATLAFQIEHRGYRALPVPQGRPYNEARLAGLISHKLVAHLAGLGWIGKNCLLITKAHGPRVRWVTVLSDAPLASTGKVLEDADQCKSCDLCVELCPVQAFTGAEFRLADPVEVRFDRQRCKQYLGERDRVYGARVCGLCVYVCSHGWSMKRKHNAQRTTPELLRTSLAGVTSTEASHVQEPLMHSGDNVETVYYLRG